MAQNTRSPADVRAYLEQHHLEVVELPADTGTATRAAEALNTTVDTIVKSLLFVVGDEPVLVLAAGDRTVETGELERLVGAAKARLARPQEVKEITGYAVGGVPPLAHGRPLRTLVDRHLMQHGIVYAAAGASNAIFAVAPEHLLDLSGGELADIAR
jgi:prolyl-tRNA editing enzyme YbaK/EbsC (Cys-tRNA(Pro) deacylase)